MRDRWHKKGFTLIEIITVVAIIGILVAVAVANFVGARRVAQRNACIANLKQIRNVVDTWAIDTGAASNAVVTKEGLIPNYIRSWPREGDKDYPVPADIGATPACPNASENTDHTL